MCFCRLLSEGPRLSSSTSVSIAVQPDAAKQPLTSVGEVSQPPPYQPTPYHPPPQGTGLLSSSPQQSLYTPTPTADYSSLQHLPAGPPQPHHPGSGGFVPSLSTTQPSWGLNPPTQSQMTSVYTAPQPRYVCTRQTIINVNSF